MKAKKRSKTLSIIAATLLVFVISCSRKIEKSEQANVTLKTPVGQLMKAKAALNGIPQSKRACYALNVTGDGISSNSSTCSPKTGMLSGFVDGGGSLSMSVSYGTRNFEVYALIVEATVPCPTLTQSKLDQFGVSNLYFIGKAGSVVVNQPDMSVDIAVSYPGQDQNVVGAGVIPASCAPTLPTGSPQTGVVGMGGTFSSGKSYIMNSGVVAVPQKLTKGSKFQIKPLVK